MADKFESIKTLEKGDLVRFPGSKLSPEFTLHRALDDKDRCKAIAIIFMDKDGIVECFHSAMEVKELAFMKVHFDQHVREKLFEEDDD